jgi:hypothetical protein
MPGPHAANLPFRSHLAPLAVFLPQFPFATSIGSSSSPDAPSREGRYQELLSLVGVGKLFGFKSHEIGRPILYECPHFKLSRSSYIDGRLCEEGYWVCWCAVDGRDDGRLVFERFCG